MKVGKNGKKMSPKGGKKARGTAAVALATLQEPQPLVVKVDKPWKWTKAKREAVEMYCQGIKRPRIAKNLQVSRKTIYRWSHNPVFLQACRDWGQEQHRIRKGRRVHAIGVLADSLTQAAANQLEALALVQQTDKGATMHKDGIAQMGMLFREAREVWNQEREDFGDAAAKRVEGQVFHHVFAPGQATVTEQQQAQAKGVGSQSFAEYVQAHGDPALLKQPASTPVQALVVAGRAVASDPQLVADLFDDEDEDERR